METEKKNFVIKYSKLLNYKVDPKLSNINNDEIRDFICPICKFILRNPIMCKYCENKYCKECITDWLRLTNTCKNCKNLFIQGKILSLFISSLYSFKIICPNRSHGCQKQICYEFLYDHIEECIYSEKIFVCISCGQEFNQSNINDGYIHFDNCHDKDINCPYCLKFYRNKNYKHHSIKCKSKKELSFRSSETNCEIVSTESASDSITDISESDYYKNIAYDSMDNKNYLLAIDMFKKSLSIDPTYFDSLIGLGYAYYLQKNFIDADIFYEMAMKVNINNYNIYYFKGLLYLAKHRPAESISYLKIANQYEINLHNVYSTMGIAYRDSKEFNKSLFYLDKAINLNPKIPDLYLSKGVTLKHMKKLNEALEFYNKAISIDVNFISAYINKIIVTRELKYYDESIRSFNIAITIDPNSIASYFNYGVLMTELCKFNEAIKCYNKILSINPKCITSYINMGDIYFKLNDYKTAFELYDIAYRIKPNHLANEKKEFVLSKIKKTCIIF